MTILKSAILLERDLGGGGEHWTPLHVCFSFSPVATETHGNSGLTLVLTHSPALPCWASVSLKGMLPA